MGQPIQKVADFGKDLAGFFTGGTSGANIAEGKAPTAQTLGMDAAGLGLGAGIGGSGILAGGASAAGSGAGGAVLDPTGLGPADVGFNPTTGNLGLSPGAMEAFGLGGSTSDLLAPRAPGTTGGAATPAGASPAAPAGPAAPPAAPAAPGAGVAAPAGASTTGNLGVDGILESMRKNAGLIGLGISGLSLANAGRQKIPNEQALNDLAATGSQAAKDLIGAYRTGQLSAGQQAQLDLLSQQTKNQINQYFASIGQSDSTAHQQALAQVDQQAFGMKQQMLDNMLQQGLNAIGVASGPLKTVADFTLGQDKALTEALGNFASAVGNAFGRTSGTTTSTTKPTSGTGVGSTTTTSAP